MILAHTRRRKSSKRNQNPKKKQSNTSSKEKEVVEESGKKGEDDDDDGKRREVVVEDEKSQERRETSTPPPSLPLPVEAAGGGSAADTVRQHSHPTPPLASAHLQTSATEEGASPPLGPPTSFSDPHDREEEENEEDDDDDDDDEEKERRRSALASMVSSSRLAEWKERLFVLSGYPSRVFTRLFLLSGSEEAVSRRTTTTGQHTLPSPVIGAVHSSTPVSRQQTQHHTGHRRWRVHPRGRREEEKDQAQRTSTMSSTLDASDEDPTRGWEKMVASTGVSHPKTRNEIAWEPSLPANAEEGWEGVEPMSSMVAFPLEPMTVTTLGAPPPPLPPPPHANALDWFASYEAIFGVDRRWWKLLLPFSPVRAAPLYMDKREYTEGWSEEEEVEAIIEDDEEGWMELAKRHSDME